MAKLQGLKSSEGHNPRVIVAGKNLTHLDQTFLTYIKENLDASNTPYRHDKKHSRLFVGTVETVLVSLEAYENILGLDVCCISHREKIITRKSSMSGLTKPVKTPIMKIKEGDEVLTRKGWRKVKRVFDNGVRDTFVLNGLRLTPDHKVWDNGWRRADEAQSVLKLDLRKLRSMERAGLFDGDTAAKPPVRRVTAKTRKAGGSLASRALAAVLGNGRRKERVYDIEVEGEHEYFAGGILVHNCIFTDELSDLNNDEASYEAFRALNERLRQRIVGFRPGFIASGTSAQGQDAVYRLTCEFRKNGTGFTLVRGRTEDNTELEKVYVDSFKRLYSKLEYDVFCNAMHLAVGQGRVFPDFDWNANVIKTPMDREIGAHETVYFSTDVNSGYNRGCAAVLRGGIIYVMKDFEFPELRTMPKTLRDYFPHQKIIFLPDCSAKNEVKILLRDLHKYSIYWVTRGKNPPVEDSVMTVNKLLYSKRLIFTEAAPDVANDVARLMRDKKTNQVPKGNTPSSAVHWVDSVRMLAYYLVSTMRELQDIRRVTLLRNSAAAVTNSGQDEPAVEEEAAGYVKINPAALGPRRY